MAFSIVIGGAAPEGSGDISDYVSGIEPDMVYRARSVRYALDGTAHEDRLGGGKSRLKITFSGVPEELWEIVKLSLDEKTVTVTGQIGGQRINGSYRLADNVIPTPVLVIHRDGYYTNTFAVTLEEI